MLLSLKKRQIPMKNEVIVTGSFDPITLGHMDIIKRAASVFEKVRVVMFINPEKEYMFSEDERFLMMKKACCELENVSVDRSSGMVIHYVKENQISAIIRGIRNSEDYLYEVKMAEYNKKHGGVDTLFFQANEKLEVCSSTIVRERILNSEPLDDLLPASVISIINNKA